MTDLFTPLQAGDLVLPNRILMAPLTRCRAEDGHVPGELMATHYAQRASAGLLIAEATMAMEGNSAFWHEPGIHSEAQVAGWKKVTDAVHAAGGRIVLQIWHGGRACHPLLNDGRQPVAPSALAITGDEVHTPQGKQPYVVPRELRDDELPGIVAGFARAAENARAAGFDGVEVHGANGYLLEQFLRDSLNDRSDAYGGTIANRARLMLEVMDAVVGEVGAGRTGVRLSPVTPANDLGQDSDAQALYGHVVEKLAPMKLAYLHLIEGATGGPRDAVPFDFEALRRVFKAANPAGAWMVNNGYDPRTAEAALASGHADLVSFGKAFISMPDLAERIRRGGPYQGLDRATLYGGGAQGYIDYPALAD